MKHMLRFTGALLLIAAGLSTQLPAQEDSVSGTPQVEPAATQALERMGAYLRTLKAFQVQTQGTSEIVMPDGQKVTLSQRTNLLARMPDKLMADINGDRGSKLYLFDGKTFTLFARDAGYYATTAAPARCGNWPMYCRTNTTSRFRWSTCSCGVLPTTLRRNSFQPSILGRPRSTASPANNMPSGRRASTGKSGYRRETILFHGSWC